MTKTQAKAIALNEMMSSVGVAYYKICDSGDYSAEEETAILEEMNKLGERIAKALRTKYVTY